MTNKYTIPAAAKNHVIQLPKCLPNTDPATGIPHGFVAGRLIPYLIERIQDRGVNETYKAWKADVERQVTDAISDLEAPSAEEFVAAVASGVSSWTSKRDAEDIATRARDSFFDAESKTFDIGEVVDFCQTELNEDMEFDEESYSWVKDGVTYELGWLGGAHLLRVSRSPWVTYGTPCSPCVPGGVNAYLPQPDTGVLCYCPAPDDWPWEEIGAVILKLLPDGSTEPYLEPARG